MSWFPKKTTRFTHDKLICGKVIVWMFWNQLQRFNECWSSACQIVFSFLIVTFHENEKIWQYTLFHY